MSIAVIDPACGPKAPLEMWIGVRGRVEEKVEQKCRDVDEQLKLIVSKLTGVRAIAIVGGIDGTGEAIKRMLLESHTNAKIVTFRVTVQDKRRLKVTEMELCWAKGCKLL